VPSFLELDVSPLVEINQALHVSDLELPYEVTLLTDPEQVVAKVAPPAVEPEPEVEEEEEAVEGEAAEEEAAEEGEAKEAAAETEESSE
jgi:large subunit ribosomal protein L25